MDIGHSETQTEIELKGYPNLRHEYHARHYGILKECLPVGEKVVPPDWKEASLRMSILGSNCVFINYHLPPLETLDEIEWTRIHMMRTTFGLLIVAIFFLF